jgi:hypothetical protein
MSSRRRVSATSTASLPVVAPAGYVRPVAHVHDVSRDGVAPPVPVGFLVANMSTTRGASRHAS